MLKAKLKRGEIGCYISVIIGRLEYNIFEHIEECCCKIFSLNELLNIKNQIEEQIKVLPYNEIIPSFTTIIEKIKIITIKRQIEMQKDKNIVPKKINAEYPLTIINKKTL